MSLKADMTFDKIPGRQVTGRCPDWDVESRSGRALQADMAVGAHRSAKRSKAMSANVQAGWDWATPHASRLSIPLNSRMGSELPWSVRYGAATLGSVEG